MNDLINIFNMSEVSYETRIRVLRKMGNFINHSYGMNITDEIVDELVDLLKQNGGEG